MPLKPNDLLQIAAVIIIIQAIVTSLREWHEERRREIEQEAVEAELRDCQNGDGLYEGISAERRERREQQLRLRYPQYLISQPDWRYFSEAKKHLKQTWKERRWVTVIAWGVALLIWVAWTALHYFLGW